jgi:hypothetical protein
MFQKTVLPSSSGMKGRLKHVTSKNVGIKLLVACLTYASILKTGTTYSSKKKKKKKEKRKKKERKKG